MTNSITFGWLVTFIIFIGCTAGGYHFYQDLQAKNHVQAFRSCMNEAQKHSDPWISQGQISRCQTLYPVSIIGRYGPQSTETITLAMVQRPLFSSH